ncbi:DUF488 family protein [Solidesulfovibrio alcoholivorans]|uniref:DUF488 family protein, N3 subclade n=1 Tax=Solidesulfovibrio alcoholivorans TaxID=81406 RepID=UPI0012EB33ED|nr:DUF488 family protein [Solidesulfovibrio alcoholivorans]
MITTSYFAREKDIANPVCIAQVKPSWSKSREYKKLAPPWALVDRYKRGLVTPQQYTQEFTFVVLSLLNPVEVMNEIVSLFGEDATLLCYEKSGDFCHRRIVAAWIEKGTGVVVPEMKF